MDEEMAAAIFGVRELEETGEGANEEMGEADDMGEEDEEEEEEEEEEEDKPTEVKWVPDGTARNSKYIFKFELYPDSEENGCLQQIKGAVFLDTAPLKAFLKVTPEGTPLRGEAADGSGDTPVGTLDGTLIDRRHTQGGGFHYVVDTVSDELQHVGQFFCDDRGNLRSSKVSGLETVSAEVQRQQDRGGFLHVDMVSLDLAHRGSDLGLRFVQALLEVFLAQRWTFAAILPGCQHPSRMREPPPRQVQSLSDTCVNVLRKTNDVEEDPFSEVILQDMEAADEKKGVAIADKVRRHFARLGFKQACPMSAYWYVTPSRVTLCKKAEVADLVISHPEEDLPVGPLDLVLERLVMNHADAYADAESSPSQVIIEGNNAMAFLGRHVAAIKEAMKESEDLITRDEERLQSGINGAGSAQQEVEAVAEERRKLRLQLEHAAGDAGVQKLDELEALELKLKLKKAEDEAEETQTVSIARRQLADGRVQLAAVEAQMAAVKSQVSGATAIEKELREELEAEARAAVLAGADPNRACVLHRCAANGMSDEASLRILVELGADVNHQDASGYTPLHVAAASLKPAAVRIFLSLGARPDVKDSIGRVPYEHARMEADNQQDWRGTFGLDERINAHTIQQLLDRYDALLLLGRPLGDGRLLEDWLSPRMCFRMQLTAREVHDHSAEAVEVIRSDEEQIGADWLTYAINVSACKYVDNLRALSDIAGLDTHAYVCGYVQCFKAIRAVLEQGQVPKVERVQQEIDNHPTSYSREWSSCFCSHGGRVDWALDAILQEASKMFTLKSGADNVSGFEEPWKSQFNTLPTNATLDADFEMVYVKLLGPGFKRARFQA